MKLPGMDQNYYDLLEVSPDAGPDEIHRAYERARQTYSVGSPALYTMFSPEEARELLLMVEEAFRTLSNIKTRRDYDRKIAQTNMKMVLPDFEVPATEGTNPALQQRGKGTPHESGSPGPSSLPEGFKKTRFGVYEVTVEMEEYIRTATKIDGEYLRTVRSYKKINLEQLSAETRISKAYLAALEGDDSEGLPAPVFTRGFVVQLARIYGLEEQKVASAYMKNLLGTS